jgi:hypothetical protein
VTRSVTELMDETRADVDRMLSRLAASWGVGGGRRLRLFACGCCRQVWPLLAAPSRAAVEAAERFADGAATGRELAGPRYSLSRLGAAPAEWWAAEAAAALAAWLRDAAREVAHHAARALRDAAGEDDWSAARRRQAALLCDLYGGVGRTVPLDPAWLRWQDGTAHKMAEAIYQGHRFGDLPILGDALEEAGCASAEVLDHCRKPGEHARGCWLLDAILGKGGG